MITSLEQTQPSSWRLIAGMVGLQVGGLLTLSVFVLAAYATDNPLQTWGISISAGMILLIGLGGWFTLAWFLAVRISNLIEWVLDRSGVLPVLDHNPAEYGIPMGLESYAKLIDDRNHEILLQGVLSTGWLITHEFGQPLSLLKDFVGGAGSLPAETANHRLKLAGDQVRRLIAYVLALDAFRDGVQPNDRIDLAELVRDLVRAHSASSRVDLSQLDSTKSLEVYGLKPLLGAAIGNLLRNALRHSEGKVFVVLERQRDEDKSTEWVVIRVEDQGAHLLEEQVANLFRSPLRQTNSKHGLGLPLSRVYCRLHKGDLRYDADGSRKAFVIILPLA